MAESTAQTDAANANLHRIDTDQVQTAAATSFLPVDPGILSPGHRRPFDLYERVADETVLLCSGDVELTARRLAQFADAGRGASLYVPSEQGPKLTAHVEGILSGVMGNSRVGVEGRARILYGAARSIMADILARPSAPGAVKRGMALANVTVDFMLSEPWAMKSMASLFAKDYYTYTHCVHVCVLGVGMYRHVVTQDATLLRRMGLGLLLHDTGKSVVRQSVLNKPDRLTDEEFAHMKSHPVSGWEVLRGHGLDDDLIRSVVLGHHERPDGTGYPLGVGGRELSVESRIAAVVDIYDALTTDRPYRRAMDHAAAMAILQDMAPDKVDAEIVAGFDKVATNIRRR